MENNQWADKQVKKKQSKTPLIIDSNKVAINPTDVPNQFNKYFTELGGKLSNDIPPSTSTPDRYFASFECPRNAYLKYLRSKYFDYFLVWLHQKQRA